MLNVLKKLCLIVMVVLLFGLTPMLNATSFFQEVGIDQYGKIVETDKIMCYTLFVDTSILGGLYNGTYQNRK